MYYDAVERVVSIVEANFETDMRAVVADKSESGITATATIHSRRPAALFADKTADLPGIGIYPTTARTQARHATIRDSRIDMVIEYCAVGSNPDQLEKQVELAVESLLRSIDRIGEGTDGVLGGGELTGDIETEIFGAGMAAGQRYFEEVGTLRFTVIDREQGLT